MTMKTKPPPASERDLTPEEIAAAAADMVKVLEIEPQLGDFGFGVSFPSGKTPEERIADLERNRASICEPRSLAQFMAARRWLRQFIKTKALSDKGSSYGLKHVAERDIGYLTNGVFIAAAIAEGFKVRRIRDTANAQIAISAKAWATIPHRVYA
jgi:hypothetical protein